jgi:F0F1-type ATP synthase assembly protein I
MAFVSGIVVGVMIGAFFGLVVMALMTAASDRREEE